MRGLLFDGRAAAVLVWMLAVCLACTPSSPRPTAEPVEGSEQVEPNELPDDEGDPDETPDDIDDESWQEPEFDEAPEPPTTRYTIQPGDSLWAIARRNDCTIQALRDANGFADDLIVAGRTMVIPDCSSLTPAEAPRPEPIAGGRTYRIRPGDYLEKIAVDFGCSVPQLMTANGLQNDVIFAGNILQIPDCSVVDDGTDSARTFVDGQMPDDPTEGTARPASPGLVDLPDGAQVYTVRGGDYLGRIASQFGCSIAEISRANDLPDDRIRVGQRLVIPACSGEGGLYAGFGDLQGERSDAPPRTGTADRTVAAASASPPARGGGRTVRDNDSLERLMRARGFRPPSGFKAYVLEIRFNEGRARVEQERHFSWGRSAYEASGWNPASTIKIYAAIAAFREIRRLGFTGNARIRFHGAQRDYEFVLNDLVREAIVDSSNISYNYLVTFVGFDRLHTDFFSERFGFRSAGLRRAYEGSNWMRMGWSSSFASSPRITVSEGSRTREIAARSGRAASNCHGAACSTLYELGTTMRRVMLQEQLPDRESFGLHADDLRTLRLALRAPRSRGEEVVRSLGQSIRGDGVHFYHKAGFAGDWYSDNVYIYNPRSNRAWIVALAGRPGRNSLNDAARIIGELIASGELSGV